MQSHLLHVLLLLWNLPPAPDPLENLPVSVHQTPLDAPTGQVGLSIRLRFLRCQVPSQVLCQRVVIIVDGEMWRMKQVAMETLCDRPFEP